MRISFFLAGPDLIQDVNYRYFKFYTEGITVNWTSPTPMTTTNYTKMVWQHFPAVAHSLDILFHGPNKDIMEVIQTDIIAGKSHPKILLLIWGLFRFHMS